MNKFLKFGMALGLILILGASLMGEPVFSRGKTKLTIWSEKSFAPQADKILIDAVNQFAKENQIEVEVVNISWSEYLRKLIAAIEVKATPDIAMIDNGATLQYGSSGLLLDVSEVFQEAKKAQGEPIQMAAMDATIKGKQYSIPLTVITFPMNCRRDLLEAKGLGIPRTWDEFLKTAKAVANPPKVYSYGLTMGNTRDAEVFLTQILWSFGMEMVSKDGKKVTFDSPNTVAGLKYIAELYKTVPPGVTGWDDSGDNRAFQSEQIAFCSNSGTVYQWALANKPDLAERMTIALSPEGPAGRHNLATMRSLAIFKSTQHAKMAKKLLAYIMKSEIYQNWLEGYGGYYPPAYAGTAGNAYWRDPVRKVFMENAKYGRWIGWPGPLSVPAREIFSSFTMTEMVQSVIAQGKTPEQAVKETAQKIKDIYARY